MSDPPDARLAVYADYVCPFCYLGEASLRRYRSDVADPPAVEWRPFDLRANKRGSDGEIDHGADDGKDEAYFDRVRENVARLRERYDVEMLGIDEVPTVDSWNAQQVALSVQRDHDADTFRAFHDAVFDALWRAGRDIGDPEVLADLAGDAGLGGADIRTAVTDQALAADLRERFAEAQKRGVTGVPTFVYGEHAARGAVPPEQLRRLVDGG